MGPLRHKLSNIQIKILFSLGLTAVIGPHPFRAEAGVIPEIKTYIEARQKNPRIDPKVLQKQIVTPAVEREILEHQNRQAQPSSSNSAPQKKSSPPSPQLIEVSRQKKALSSELKLLRKQKPNSENQKKIRELRKQLAELKLKKHQLKRKPEISGGAQQKPMRLSTPPQTEPRLIGESKATLTLDGSQIPTELEFTPKSLPSPPARPQNPPAPRP